MHRVFLWLGSLSAATFIRFRCSSTEPGAVLPVEDAPVAELLLCGACRNIVVQVNKLGEEMSDHLSSHNYNNSKERLSQITNKRNYCSCRDEVTQITLLLLAKLSLLPASLKSLVMCLLGRDRGILSIHANRSCSSSSFSSRSIIHKVAAASELFLKIKAVLIS